MSAVQRMTRAGAMAAGLALALTSLAQAAQSDYGSSSVAAPWLKLPSSVRDAGMGGASAALGGEANSVQQNPAALADLKGQQASFVHNAWLQGSAVEDLSYGLGLGASSGLGLAFNYLSFGSVDRYTLDSGGQPVANGSYSPSAMNLAAGYGSRWQDLAVGASVKVLTQSLDGSSMASAVGADLGARWQALPALAVGVAAQNLGSSLEGSALPVNLKAGLGLVLGASTLAADVNLPTGDSSAYSLNVGGEYWVLKQLAGRVGYRFSDNAALGGLSGLSAGLSLRYGWAQLDYAFTAYGDLGDDNLIGLSAQF
jgi:hypothetical protein